MHVGDGLIRSPISPVLTFDLPRAVSASKSRQSLALSSEIFEV